MGFTGAIGAAPVNPTSAYAPSGWASRVGTRYVPGMPAEGNPQVVDGIFMVHSQGAGTGTWLDSIEGWTGILQNGLFFKITYPVSPGTPGPWGSSLNTSFFYAGDRIEIEPASPYFTIPPGAPAQWTIHWSLTPTGPLPSNPAELAARIKQLAKKH